MPCAQLTECVDGFHPHKRWFLFQPVGYFAIFLRDVNEWLA